MVFIILLILSALTISATAGYFSIYGLAAIFTGSFWSIVIMGSSLEVGKLMAASYVYRFWDKINFLMKTYLISAIIVLMFITSVGIFGFLSASYQEDSIPLAEMSGLVDDYKIERTKLEARKQQMDNDIAALPNNYVSGRKRLQTMYKDEFTKIRERLDVISTELSKVQKQKIVQESHTGPIIYIAKVMNKDVDNAIKYMIFMIMFAFDPLALVLVLATNSAISDRKLQKERKEPIKLEPVVEKVIEEVEDEIEIIEEAVEEAVEEIKEFVAPIEISPEIKATTEQVAKRKNLMESIRSV